MSDDRPIGVFDSGLGGLTAVKELRRLLPGEDIIYFGDTGRVPYGTRGRDTIVAYARQDIAFLLSKNVKTILAACGTVSSTFPIEESSRLPVLYNGVVQAAAKAAMQATQNNKIGIIGTEATIASQSYQQALLSLSPHIQSTSNACPLFVPLVENGHFGTDDPMVQIAAEKYLAPIQAAGVDTLILGCTHYPLLSGAIQKQVYLEIIEEAGFKNITLQKDKAIIIPDDILANYLSPEEIQTYKNGKTKIISITVYAEKPAKDDRNCCEPGSGCC